MFNINQKKACRKYDKPFCIIFVQSFWNTAVRLTILLILSFATTKSCMCTSLFLRLYVLNRWQSYA